MKKHFLFACLFACIGHAQYFNNNAFQLSVGWMGMDSTASFMTPTNATNPWPTSDQLQIGLGYQYALSGYNLWWVTQSELALGYAKNYGLSDSQILTGITAFTGLRYNFATLAWRPFVMGGVGLLTLFTDPNSVTSTNGTTSRSWMTFQVGPGIEWIFTDEMSFQLETGGLAFLDFQRAARFSYVARLSYLIYF
ncbi:MAG: outer membrane beta-barrel protein [Myxococcota bacterium]